MLTDIRYALRALGRSPGFTVVAVLTLALGIGANTAIFSVVNGVLLRPLPYPDPGRIVQFWTTTAADGTDSHTAGDFMDFTRGQRSLESLAGYREDAVTIAEAASEPARVSGAIVTAQYFEVFGTPAALGRVFNAAADAKTAEPLVVLGDEVWRTQFGSDPGTVGSRVRLNGVPHTVLGIMPGGFDYPENVRLWVLSPQPVPLPPVDIPGDLLEARDVRYFQAVGRLKPGVALEAAEADLGTLQQDITRRFPSPGASRGVRLQPLHERIVGDVRNALLLLLGAVGVVLLIACANVSSLVLARGSGRQRELAVRAAMGASRGRIARQLITESLVLAIVGGTAGLLAGAWAIKLLVAVLPEGTPRAAQIGLDAQVAAAAILVSIASALIFGLVPALQASRTEAASVLRSGERGSTGDRRRARMRSVLVVAEVALTLVLLVSAGLLGNSFLRLQRVDPGFDPAQVTLVPLPLPQSKYTNGEAQAAVYRQILEGIRQRPEITSAAILFPSPLQGNSANGGFSIEGRPPVPPGGEQPRTAIGSVSSDYFRTMGIPLLRGRDFTDQDRQPSTRGTGTAPRPAVALVNAALANRYFPGEDPLGRRVRFGEDADDWITVVGITADTRNVGLDAEPVPTMFIPYHDFALPFMSVAVKSPAGLAAVTSVVREQLKAADPELPMDRVVPMTEVIDDSMSEPRFRTLLLGAFAVMAILLATIGVYGLISYSVTQRTREIGIRIALGATPSQVIRPVVRQGLVLGATGVAIGLAGAAAVTRLLASFLFGIEATDPMTFAAVALLMLAIALLASYIPSRRALRVDPITALRAE